MSTHVFHEIYLHLNWHTKNDAPLLTPQVETLVFQMLRQRCVETPGVYFHAIGGTEIHNHLVINIEPQVCISDFVGKLKGGVSHDINEHSGRKVLEWQRGFGVVSFSKNQLAWVIEYVNNQKKHHVQGTLSLKLEETAEDLLAADA